MILKCKDADPPAVAGLVWKGKEMEIEEILNNCANNLTIFDSLVLMKSKLESYESVVCSISGGSDSDIVLDLVTKIDKDKKVKFVWFDTGLEYQATKEHLKFLEEKYNIKFYVEKAVKPIPITCKEFGQPFLSKKISDNIYRLQKHGFKWENKSFEELLKEYPKCKSALRWWCNNWGDESMFNISRNKYLKEFMIENPPTFAISPKCCDYAKKKPLKNFMEKTSPDLNLYGVRKAEGGARATAYKTCFTSYENKASEYRPIFWYKDDDKKDYENAFGVAHSKCYTEYGLTRTGCAGCPFGKDFEKELQIIEKHEPKFFKAVNNIFGLSYEYTRKYLKFAEEMKKKEKQQN